jgi:hypothetical protein
MPPHDVGGSACREALAADGDVPSAQWSRLGNMHVHGAGTLLSLLNLECNPKPLFQRLECRAFDPRSMEEDLASIISRDEAKPALLHHPFDFPRCHDVALSRVRVLSYRPFPTSIVMHPLQPLPHLFAAEAASHLPSCMTFPHHGLGEQDRVHHAAITGNCHRATRWDAWKISVHYVRA